MDEYNKKVEIINESPKKDEFYREIPVFYLNGKPIERDGLTGQLIIDSSKID